MVTNGSTTYTMTPAFNQTDMSYVVDVPYEVTNATIVATAIDLDSTISGDGNKTLSEGTNIFTVTVIATNGNNKIYSVIINREKPKKLLYAPFDSIGESVPSGLVFYAPMDGAGFPNENLGISPAVHDKVASYPFLNLGGSKVVNGVRYGSMSFSTSIYKYGLRSLYLEGLSGQRVNGDILANFGQGDFTVCFWVYPETIASNYAIFFGNDSSTNLRMFARDGDSSGRITLAYGGTRILNTGLVYKKDVWTHYAVVRASGTIYVYENGIFIKSVASTQNIDLSNISIGGNLSTAATAYKGYIDEFAIYDYAKYTSDFAPDTENSDANVLYLDFEDEGYTEDGIYDKTPIYEAISGTDMTINTMLEGRDDKYIFGDSSLYFAAGTSQRLTMNVPVLNFGANDFTISFWAYPEIQRYTSAVFFAHQTAGSLIFFAQDSSNGGTMVISSGATRIIKTNKMFTPHTWKHYALVRKSGNLTLYENGKNLGSYVMTGNVNLSSFSIGGYSNANTPYKGYIDDFAVYNYAKYSKEFSVPSVDSFNDPNNVSSKQLEIVDTVSNNSFTVLGGARLVGANTNAKFGASLYFPGTNGQRINIKTNKLDLQGADFTVSLWAYPETQVKSYSILFGNDASTGLRFFLRDANLSGNMSISNGGTRIINTNKKYTPNKWSHYALVRKNGVLTLYEDGKTLKSVNFTSNAIFSNLSIGGNYGASAYKGYVDDFAIYNAAMYNGDFTSP